jgi:hypothetical protein
MISFNLPLRHLEECGGGESAPCESHLEARIHGLLDEIADDLLELGAGELHVHVLGPRGVHGEVGQVDVRLEGAAQLDLCLLGRLPHPLQRHCVLAAAQKQGDVVNRD